MITRRKQKLLVSLEERQLVLNSTVINEYPKIKELLLKYDRIYQSDFEDTGDFTPEDQNFLKFSFSKVVEEASKEWYACAVEKEEISSNSKEWKRCSLCTTPNKYIFYIRNRLNNTELNVGSDCIGKFPELSDKVGNITIAKLKSNRIKQFKQIERINKFNKRFPDALRTIKKWRAEYEQQPVVMSKSIHMRAQDLFEEASGIYSGYTNGKMTDSALDRFAELIKENEKLREEINDFLRKQVNEKMACSREIKEWLQVNSLNGILERIIRDGGVFTEETIGCIYEKNFVESFLDEFNTMLKGTYFTITGIEDMLRLVYNDSVKKRRYEFECSTKEFMKRYGRLLMQLMPSIGEKNLIEIISPLWREENIQTIINRFNTVLRDTGYYIELQYIRGEVEYINDKEKLFSVGKAQNFIEAQKGLLVNDDKVIKNRLTNLLEKQVVSWRSIKEKGKYDVTSIMKDTYR